MVFLRYLSFRKKFRLNFCISRATANNSGETSQNVSNFSDVTEKCLQHKNSSFQLTNGRGFLDAEKVMIKTEKLLHCSLQFYLDCKGYILGVLQFENLTTEPKFSIKESVSEITISDFKNNNSSDSKPIYEHLAVIGSRHLLVHFIGVHNISVQILSTSMRDPDQHKCSTKREIECIYKEKLFCISSVFFCDGQINCGVPGLYDEDLEECTGMKLTGYMIFCILVMHLMTLGLLASLCFTLLPKRKETFAYKFDQSMPLFDGNNEAVAYDIDIIPLFPKEITASLKPALTRK